MAPRLLLTGFLLLPVLTWAGESREPPLDQALSACEHSILKTSNRAAQDYATYRAAMAEAVREEPHVREATETWHSQLEPYASATVAQWIDRCDEWYAQTAKDQLRLAILFCIKTHREGLDPHLARQAAVTYHEVRGNALSIDPTLVDAKEEQVSGVGFPEWLARCDAWFEAQTAAASGRSRLAGPAGSP